MIQTDTEPCQRRAILRAARRGALLSLVVALGACAHVGAPIDAGGPPPDAGGEALSCPSTPPSPRTLTPKAGVLHCAGQSVQDFADYFAAMPAGEKPGVYMAYANLREDWGLDHRATAAAIAADLKRYPEVLAVQLGLSMVSGTHGAPFEADVASGALDDKIESLLDALESLARPVYLRIGYEFNGVAWNGYKPDSYREAYRHIARAARKRSAEIALVWDASAAGDQNTEPYYPGDDLVDWWGINIFSPPEIGAKFTLDFLAQARAHGKPVVIGESSPKDVGTLAGQQSWDGWFGPYFHLIADHPEIQMFCYINTNWAGYPDFPEWASWGDGRLQQNATTRALYGAELANPRYLHGTAETSYRARFGIADTTPPAPVRGLRADAAGGPGGLAWECDDTDVAAYLVDRDGSPIDRTRSVTYRDPGTRAGAAYAYRVRAIDWAGNVSEPSSALTVQMPKQLSRLANGDFEHGLDGWTLLSLQGAAGKLEAGSVESGHDARVTIQTSTGTNWHLQLTQSVELHAGLDYALRFRARAAAPTAIQPMLQQEAAPYATYAALTAQVGTAWQSFTLSGKGADVRTRVTFMLGAATASTIEIDDVELLETAP